MNNFWNWLVTSSADPEKTSATLKGLLTLGAGYVLNLVAIACGFGLVCLNIDADWISQVVNAITVAVTGFLMIVGAVTFLFGAARKAYFGRWSAFEPQA